MDRNCRSIGHAGGTRAPLRWVRPSQLGEFWAGSGHDYVPQRAPRVMRSDSTAAEFRGRGRPPHTRGTTGHAWPAASAGVHGRA